MTTRPRTPSEQAEALAAAGRIGEAFALLTGSGTDADALFTLATWRLSGDLIRRDLGEARRLFGRAADHGRADAEPVYIAMLANGAGSERDWPAAIAHLTRRARSDLYAARELASIDAMRLDANGDASDAAASVPIGTAPNVTAYPAFLTPEECRLLIDAAAPYLQPSMVVDPRSGQPMRDPVRTSHAAAFPFVLETPFIHAINRRIAKATATAPEQGEPAQILRYRPGEEYKPHIDALTGTDNPRATTFLIYLNTDYRGGETLFLSSGLRVRGGLGDAVSFGNMMADGRPDPSSRHAGLPVVSGQKLIVSKWIRARPLDLSGPPGRPF